MWLESRKSTDFVTTNFLRLTLSCLEFLESGTFFCRFQVPASCRDPQAYTHALSDARCIFDMAVSSSSTNVIIQ